jgi:hypothetical protein
MRASGTAQSLFCTVLCFLLVVATACDSGGDMDNDNDNSPPNASVTADKKKPTVGDSVRLDASKSDDPDGDKLTFNWTLETPDGSNTALSAQTAVDPQFIPDTSGNYTARVNVDDGSLSDTDEVSVGAEEDEPDSVTVKTTLSTTDNGTLANCVVEFTPESGDTVRKQSCNGPSATFPKDSGTVAVHATADDYQQMEKTTSTESDRTLEFTLEPETPDQSTVTFAVTEADTLVTAEIFVADTLAADGVEPTAVFPFDKTINARVESEFLETTQISFTTDTEEKTVTVSLQRKTAEIAITPRDDEGNILAEAKTVIREPNNTDSTTVTGDSSVELLQLPGRREVETRLITERPDNPDRLIRYKPFSTTVSASEDAELVPSMARLPACDDSISNDEDELVDVWKDVDGNSVPNPKDTGDWGCLSKTDDNEGHWTIRNEWKSLNKTDVISNAEGNRVDELIDASGSSLVDESILDAVGGAILVSREAQMETDESGEDWALRFNTGPENELGNVNTTEVVTDQDTTDGWDKLRFIIPADWFATGQYYKILGVHGSKIRDEPPGNGGGEVVFLRADGEPRVTLFFHVLEDEDYEGLNDSAKGATDQNTYTNCRQKGGVEVCTTVRADGFP